MKNLKSLEKIEKKLIRSEKQKHENSLNQIRKIKSKLFPNQQLQERIDNLITYYNTYGEKFIETLKQELDPLDSNFLILSPLKDKNETRKNHYFRFWISIYTTYCRRVRELNIYCEIHPYNKIPSLNENVKSVILSGSPFSVRDKNCPIPNLEDIKGKIPLLGVCYGSFNILQK